MFLTGQAETKDWTENSYFHFSNELLWPEFICGTKKKKKTWKPVVGGILYLCVTDL